MKKLNISIIQQVQLLCCSMVFVLAGCQSSPKPPTDVTDALDNAIIQSSKTTDTRRPLKSIPNSVRQELMKKKTFQARQGLLAEKRIEMAAKDLDASQFFAGIVDGTNYSIAIHPDVTGKITLNLKDVTLNEVLDITESLYGYDIRRNGKVIQVYPSGIRTETIPLDYLYVQRTGNSSTSINSSGVSKQGGSNGGTGGNRNSNQNSSNQNGASGSGGGNNNGNSGVNINTATKSDFWSELKETLMVLVGSNEGRSVIVSPQAGLVTITALPSEIDAVKHFLADTQEHLRRQVIIEAKILEVTLNDDYQQGVEWSNVLGHIESTDITAQTNGNIANNAISASIGGLTGITFRNADFTNVITLLSTQGNVQVLSSPRITATNNQKAVIKVGDDEYFVTEVSSTTTTGTSTTTTPEVELTPFFSGIALDVTPQIDNNGEVILHIHPSVTQTDEQTKVINLGSDSYTLPLAQSSIRESDTIIRAKSGEVVIIGGLIETRKVDIDSKTPLLGDIPFVGELFKSKSQTSQKKELVIMLKPVVITQDVWKNQLQDARALLKKWFPEESDNTLDNN